LLVCHSFLQATAAHADPALSSMGETWTDRSIAPAGTGGRAVQASLACPSWWRACTRHTQAMAVSAPSLTCRCQLVAWMAQIALFFSSFALSLGTTCNAAADHGCCALCYAMLCYAHTYIHAQWAGLSWHDMTVLRAGESRLQAQCLLPRPALQNKTHNPRSEQGSTSALVPQLTALGALL
jgi:hypothetical protein